MTCQCREAILEYIAAYGRRAKDAAGNAPNDRTHFKLETVSETCDRLCEHIRNPPKGEGQLDGSNP